MLRNSSQKPQVSAEQNINTKSILSPPVEEIDEATEILLGAKEEYLKNKRYTTLQEDFELECLQDPTTRLHASRIAELAFKEDRTTLENYELKLYENQETRPYAYRIIELTLKEQQGDLVGHEKNELLWLRQPYYRPYIKEYLQILNKTYHEELSQKEERVLELFKNPSTVKHAIEIAELESLDAINSTQMQDLSIGYVCKIADIPLESNNDFHINFRSRAFNPASDCLIKDSMTNTYDVNMARFRAVQDAFNQAADKLIESYKRQVFNQMRVQSVLTMHSLFNPQNDRVDDIFTGRKDALSLTLQKIFFDNDLVFSEKNLNRVTDYLNDLVQDKKLIFNTSDYKVLEKLLKAELEHMTISPDTAPSMKR